MKTARVSRKAIEAVIGVDATRRFTVSSEVQFIVDDGMSAAASLAAILEGPAGGPVDIACLADAIRRLG